MAEGAPPRPPRLGLRGLLARLIAHRKGVLGLAAAQHAQAQAAIQEEAVVMALELATRTALQTQLIPTRVITTASKSTVN